MEHKLLIELMGGTTEVANLFGIKPPSVSGWKNSRIPDDKLRRLAVIAESKGISSRKELFPDTWQQFWPELCNATDACSQKNQEAA